MKKSILAFSVAAATWNPSAHAGLNGLAVSADLAFGANGAYRTTDPNYPYWGTANIVGPNSVWTYEQNYPESGLLQYLAVLDDSSLTISSNIDLKPYAYPNGFEMVFTTPLGFTEINLNSSTFWPNLTYKIEGGSIVVDWLGETAAISPQIFTATFNVTAVPEPEAGALLLLGLLGCTGARWRSLRVTNKDKK